MSPEDDKITVCRPTLNILKYSLIWPNEDEELDPSKWFTIRIILFTLITSAWVMAVVMHLIFTLKSGSDLNLSEDVAFVVAFTGLYTMIICYVKQQKKTAKLLVALSSFNQFGMPPNFQPVAEKLSFFSKICFAYTVGGIILYHGSKIIDIPECERMNQMKGYHEICGGLTPAWVPFEATTFPGWHLLMVYEFISCQFLMKLTLMISYMSMEMANHIILRIDHMNSMLLDCFDEDYPEKGHMKFKKCIQYHNFILDLAVQLNHCFEDGMLVHLTITGVICGCLENQLVKTDNKLLPIIHIFGWIIAIFVACLGGQHIANAGNSIPEAIYNSKWYLASVEDQKDICFMLLRSQKGLSLRAGGFGYLGFPMFLSVMKMSYSILALLTS